PANAAHQGFTAVGFARLVPISRVQHSRLRLHLAILRHFLNAQKIFLRCGLTAAGANSGNNMANRTAALRKRAARYRLAYILPRNFLNSLKMDSRITTSEKPSP